MYVKRIPVPTHSDNAFIFQIRSKDNLCKHNCEALNTRALSFLLLRMNWSSRSPIKDFSFNKEARRFTLTKSTIFIFLLSSDKPTYSQTVNFFLIKNDESDRFQRYCTSCSCQSNHSISRSLPLG